MSPILGGWPTHGRLPGFLEDKASHVPFLSHEWMIVEKFKRRGFPFPPLWLFGHHPAWVNTLHKYSIHTGWQVHCNIFMVVTSCLSPEGNIQLVMDGERPHHLAIRIGTKILVVLVHCNVLSAGKADPPRISILTSGWDSVAKIWAL